MYFLHWSKKSQHGRSRLRDDTQEETPHFLPFHIIFNIPESSGGGLMRERKRATAASNLIF
jgi:hypothetical protein